MGKEKNNITGNVAQEATQIALKLRGVVKEQEGSEVKAPPSLKAPNIQQTVEQTLGVKAEFTRDGNSYTSTAPLTDDQRSKIFDTLDRATEGSPNAKVWDWINFDDKLKINDAGAKYLTDMQQAMQPQAARSGASR